MEHIIMADGSSIARQVFIVAKNFIVRIEAVHAPGIVTNPEHPIPIFRYVLDEIIGHRIGIQGVIIINCKTSAVVFIQAILGADPDKSLLVLNDYPSGALRKAIIDRNIHKAKIFSPLTPGRGDQASLRDDKKNETEHVFIFVGSNYNK
jgi:hypothetical protein